MGPRVRGRRRPRRARRAAQGQGRRLLRRARQEARGQGRRLLRRARQEARGQDRRLLRRARRAAQGQGRQRPRRAAPHRQVDRLEVVRMLVSATVAPTRGTHPAWWKRTRVTPAVALFALMRAVPTRSYWGTAAPEETRPAEVRAKTAGVPHWQPRRPWAGTTTTTSLTTSR